MCQRAHCHKLQTKSKPPLLFSFLLLKVTSYKQSTKAFRNQNLKSADGWRDGREEEEEEEEWLVTFGTVLAMAVLWVTWYFPFPFNLTSIFLVFLLPSGILFSAGIRFFPWFFQYNPVSSGTKIGTK